MSTAEDLARRIESQASISAVPGQLAKLEQIAREVRALGAEVAEAVAVRDRALLKHAEQHAELERLHAIEQRARAVANGLDTGGPTSWARKQVAWHILGEAS
jgi:hypothetical protein